jgi:hypothetical protein
MGKGMGDEIPDFFIPLPVFPAGSQAGYKMSLSGSLNHL